jgi:hypothetical protein
VVGFDLAGQERGFPAKDHAEAYQLAHDHFLGKTVHAGEDYGPESIFQAITDCHADRIGHGTWLFSARHIQDKTIVDKKRYVEKLVALRGRPPHHARGLPDQQSADDARAARRPDKHPFRKMRKARSA